MGEDGEANRGLFRESDRGLDSGCGRGVRLAIPQDGDDKEE